MKLGDFLNTLAQKCNMSEHKALIDLLSNSELSNREIADEFANSLNTNLMSLEGAKNNAALLNHFKPIILNGIDDRFSIISEEFGLGDDISNEKNSYKKFDLLKNKINEKIAAIEAKRGKEGNAEKEAVLEKQIQELQGKLAKLNEEKEQEINTLNSKHQNEITDMRIMSILSGKRYANKDIPAEVNTLTAKNLLYDALKKTGATLTDENGVFKLKQTANPTMDYVDEGFKTVSFDGFIDKLLADNKLLEVSGGNSPALQSPVPQTILITQAMNNAKFMDAICVN